VSAFLACFVFSGAAPDAASFSVRLSLGAESPRILDVAPEARCAVVARGAVTTAVDDECLVMLAGSARRRDRDSAGVAIDVPLDARQVADLWKRPRRPTASELEGEYALIQLDRRTGALELLVDRYGQSSLFVRRTGGQVWVSTEPFPLAAAGPLAAVDVEAFPDMFSLRVLTGRYSVWEGVRQVVPGQWLTLTPNGESESPPVPCHRFAPAKTPWRMKDAAAEVTHGIRRRIERLRDEGVAEVAVPLSGGVDSTIIAAIARKVFPSCRGYTMHIEGFANPEIPRAEEVARRLGIPLTIVPVTVADIHRRFPEVIARLQEPPRHFNNMPMLCMLDAISDHASVVLAGDGVEQFGIGGLGTSLGLEARKQKLDRIPSSLHVVVSALLAGLAGRRGARMVAVMRTRLPELVQQTELIEATADARRMLGAQIGAGSPDGDTLARTFFPACPVDEMFTLWATTSLGRALNRRNTRLGQQVGVRFVYPLLDPSLLEVAATLPVEMRYDLRAGLSKPVLRRVCADLVGEDVSVWPKIGFATPEVEWIEGPLRYVYEQAFSTDSKVAELFDIARLRTLPIAPNKQTVWTLMTLDAVLRQAAALA
jgi:asparagine synthase (glutamine-hydrolysing)